MAVTLKDLYDALNAGANRATLLQLIEELERNQIRIPPELRQDLVELADIDDDDGRG